MISLEIWMILAPLQILANNVGDLGKIIVATGFEWLPKVQKIAQSGHTVCFQVLVFVLWLVEKSFLKIVKNDWPT